MKFRPVGGELFNADGRTDRHHEANSRFSHFANPSKKVLLGRVLVLVKTRWYIVLLINTSIFGLQSFDYGSDIILFRVFILLIHAKPSAYHVIFLEINLALY
jgi:hypothetical protein